MDIIENLTQALQQILGDDMYIVTSNNGTAVSSEPNLAYLCACAMICISLYCILRGLFACICGRR